MDVLAVDAQTYVGPRKRVLDHYDMVPLYRQFVHDDDNEMENLVKKIKKEAPDETEVITNFYYAFSNEDDGYTNVVITAVALVPKSKENSKKL